MRRLILCLFLVVITTSLGVAQKSDAATLVFIRHAEKVDDGSRDPDLTKKGEERASRISSILDNKYGKINAVYSTNYKRTQQTATPTALKNNVNVVDYDPRTPNVFLKSLIRKHIGEVILIVGHSNSTPTLVNFVLGEDRFEALDESVYDTIFVVESSEVGSGTVTVSSSN